MGVSRNSISGWAVGALGAGAMLVGCIAPASARDHGRDGYGYRGGGYYSGYGYPSRYKPYRHYRHRDRGLDAGDVIGIAALIGAVAIIASSAGKNKEPRPRDDEWRDRARGPEDRDDYSDRAGEDRAIDACVSAARDEAESQSGGYAEILDVETPRRSSAGGWDVEGRLEQRSSYRNNEVVTKSFSCSYERGRVADVYVSRNMT